MDHNSAERTASVASSALAGVAVFASVALCGYVAYNNHIEQKHIIEKMKSRDYAARERKNKKQKKRGKSQNLARSDSPTTNTTIKRSVFKEGGSKSR